MQIVAGYELGAGDGSCGDQIGDIQDNIHQWNIDALNLIRRSGVTIDRASEDEIGRAFFLISQNAHTDLAWQATHDAHVIVMDVWRRLYKGEPPADLVGQMTTHMTSIGEQVSGGAGGFWDDLSKGGAWLGGIVGGAIGTVLLPGIGTAIGASIGAGIGGGAGAGITYVADQTTYGDGEAVVPAAPAAPSDPWAIVKSATYDPNTDMVKLTIPGGSVSKPRAEVPVAVLQRFGLPLTQPATAANRLGVNRLKLSSGGVSASTLASGIVVPASTQAVSTYQAAAPLPPAKKAVFVIGGMGALGTLAFLAWRVMR